VDCTSRGKSKIVKTNQLENLGGFLWVGDGGESSLPFLKRIIGEKYS